MRGPEPDCIHLGLSRPKLLGPRALGTQPLVLYIGEVSTSPEEAPGKGVHRVTPLLSLYVKARMAFADRLAARKQHDDQGAGFVEYAGVLVLVAAIAAVLITDNPIGKAVETAVGDALDVIFNAGAVSEE